MQRRQNNADSGENIKCVILQQWLVLKHKQT